MANLSKLEFEALDITGKNYLPWALDVEIHLDAEGNGDTIKEGNNSSAQQKAKAMIFLRHHLHGDLKIEYLTVKDPLDLWNSLKERYDHQKTIILPKARHEWLHLRLQDYKTVTAYNSAVCRITSLLKLCGENVSDQDMLEKTFSTFHASNVLLQQQYRERGFTKYSDLIACLLLAEQNNELLMKNHEVRPTGAAAFPEVNVATHDHYGQTRGRGRGHGRGRGRGQGRGRGTSHGHVNFKNPASHQKWKNEKHEKGKGGQNSKTIESNCRRCGSKGHWSRNCTTPKHLVDLYHQSLKNKGKNIETHFAYEDGDFDYDMDPAHLELADFFADPEKKIDHLNGEGSTMK
ncbi:uncharacterized protein LOC123895789 [Trifolium pratense]|uniref:uncharacterized protein LOC123895789 n=1 Tax=Trifolium pratense TaxID=57577 RepID=UPI001E690929|nr:uncharacterized protein LOC123895789 [Trifolium pratense]